ncbi:hypothetical protein NLI96_g428 [Meripilus lineatus]|uniref:Uncharacterized protein n=1 Tax=Meripilus lineatus TaxID=2056292 RepID=A0AAD5YNZ5_9APHY|nr:hypothetical protein NLI96_g428 [Physisporinus lineatus]
MGSAFKFIFTRQPARAATTLEDIPEVLKDEVSPFDLESLDHYQYRLCQHGSWVLGLSPRNVATKSSLENISANTIDATRGSSNRDDAQTSGRTCGRLSTNPSLSQATRCPRQEPANQSVALDRGRQPPTNQVRASHRATSPLVDTCNPQTPPILLPPRLGSVPINSLAMPSDSPLHHGIPSHTIQVS